MNFNNATVLSLNRKSVFFGDVARYKSTKELSVEGLLLDLTNGSGVTGIVNQLNAFQSDNDNWQNIQIGGVSFGSGIVSNIKFSEDRDVRQKKYSVNIAIPESGDLSSLFTADYTGLDFSSFQFVESFSENTSYTKNFKKDSYSQSVRVAIKGPYTLNGTTVAKAVAQNFFQNNSLTNVLSVNHNNLNIKNFYNESYNNITNVFDFSRSFDINNDSDGTYSLSRSHTIGFDSQGIASIKEAAEYIGHTTTPFDTVSAQAYSDINNSYNRCVGIFNSYFDANNASLLTQYTSKSVTSVPFEGKLNYDITYSNSNRITNLSAYWDHEITVDKTEGGNYNLTENGSIVGFGHMIDSNTKYNNALSFFSTTKSNIPSRLNTYYPGARTISLLSESNTYNQIAGKIDYNYKYTDADSLLATQDVRKANVVISKDANRSLVTSFNIINQKEIIQVQPNLLPNQISFSISLNGAASTSIATYQSKAKSYFPNGYAYDYISDASYSYDPYDNKFTMNISCISMPAGAVVNV